ncbi:unnamed protein product [Rotaria sp. Silwood2]|nr:unnamed protein product [Rotaria sp. Silwood2]
MLKCRIQFQKNIPLSLQRFIFQGKELKDEATLAEYSINDNSTFHLVLKLRGGKLVIRLRSTSDQSISNVNVHLHINHAWNLSCIYPEPSITDKVSFIEWNNIEVYPDGHLMMNQHYKQSLNSQSYHYPFIDDELEYKMLFWEALTIDTSMFNIDHGLCVTRTDFPRVLNYLLKKMSFSSEDRDDMITYILPHLDEIDPNHIQKHVVFRFLSPNEYSNLAALHVRPEPDQIIRAFLLYIFNNDEQTTISTIENLDNEVKEILHTNYTPR